MSKVELSIEARNDLVSVWVYLAENGSEDIADRFIDQLQEACVNLAQMPTIGKSQDHIREGLKRHVYRNYSIYYDIAGQSHVIIRRFWHQSRDLESFILDEDE